MESLTAEVIKLKEKSDIRARIEERMNEFLRLKNSGSCEEIFSELSFCILTANFSAEKGIYIQKTLGNAFLSYRANELAKELRRLGHRYPEKRAEFIVNARKYADVICKKVKSYDESKSAEFREWLVKNIDGLGYKESSHFLRNVGFFNLAIIDYHILDLLKRYGLISLEIKSLTRNRYLWIERTLSEIARLTGTKLGELDLYLWYMETGKILK